MSDTLLERLARLYPDSSKTTLRQWLQNDRVRVNGIAARDAKRPVVAGDRVEVGGRRLLDPRLRLLFEDASLVVIEKPTALLTVASPEERHETVEALLGAYVGKGVHVVHRLDRDSSGVLVFAKTTGMRDRLAALFARHDLERIYVAVIDGRLDPPSGTFRSYLAEDRELQVRSVAGGGGKEAITHYRTVTAGARYALLEVTLETGRRNQIRVHVAEAGHPIVGDTMYGKGREDPLGRLALHARRLAFVHPGTGRKMTFDADAPETFAKLVGKATP